MNRVIIALASALTILMLIALSTLAWFLIGVSFVHIFNIKIDFTITHAIALVILSTLACLMFNKVK